MRRLYIMIVLVLFLGGYTLAAHRMEAVRAEGKTVLHFSAKYRSTLNYVQPGDASSTVQFKMIYQ